MLQNLFEGDKYQALFEVIIYRRLMSRRWVTHADVMAEYMGVASAEMLEYSISKCDHVTALRKVTILFSALTHIAT